MKEEKTNIDFETLKLNMVLPSSIKCANAAIRGMWLNYDHLSDYCFSIIPTYDDGDRKKLTLRQTTKREWKKRKELLQKALQQIFANEKPEESNNSAEENKPRVIDVDRMYTEYEDKINAVEREKMGPLSLNLDEHEVNLRSHRITGGVYQIEYFEQPLQDVKSDAGALFRTCKSNLLLEFASFSVWERGFNVEEKQFSFFLFLNLFFPLSHFFSLLRSLVIHPIQLKEKHFHYFFRPPPPVKPGQKRMPEEVEAEIRFVEENMERMVLISIE